MNSVYNTGNRQENSVRQELLLRMYDQMFDDITRHINIVWQPISVLVSSIALFAAAVTNIVPIDIAEALIILLAGWLIATLYDSNYLYSRNLAIITNIERHFIKQSDQKEIHYYFGSLNS